MHHSFQEYIEYKQLKYEKSLKRKCKGIYKKKNVDVNRADPKQEFDNQTKKLKLMQNLAKMESGNQGKSVEDTVDCLRCDENPIEIEQEFRKTHPDSSEHSEEIYNNDLIEN